jgi:fructosamine-3-kinase
MRQAFSDYYDQHQVIPSLLHGDLWAGNYMFDDTGQPVLIDPDAVYGDREFDLAMTTIFGGFEPAFYQAYQQEYPLAKGVNERLPWYQFYYLCMHLILFGETYGPAVDGILERY